jgi:hypothetical protein
MLLLSQKPVGNPPAMFSFPVQAAPPSPKVTVPKFEPEELEPDDVPELEPELEPELAPDTVPEPVLPGVPELEPELEPELVPDAVPEPVLAAVPELEPDVPPADPSFMLPSWLGFAPGAHARGTAVATAAASVIEIR